MQSLYASLIPLDLLFVIGFIYVIKVVKGHTPFIVLGWVGLSFWIANLIYDFVKILTL